MLEVIKSMTPDQWMTNLIFPLAVALLLLLLAFIGSKLLAFLRHVYKASPSIWFTLRVSLRELFMSKKEKELRAERMQTVHDYIRQQTDGLTNAKHTIKVPPFTLDSQGLRRTPNKK
jgi:cell division protein FtsX